MNEGLFYLLALEGICLLSAEDIDLAVEEDKPTSVSSLKGRGFDLVDALRRIVEPAKNGIAP